MVGFTVSQAKIQPFGKPPLPKGYSPSHVLTYQRCEYLFLLIYVYKVVVKITYKPLIEGSNIHKDISKGNFISSCPETQQMLNVAREFLSEMPVNPIFETSIDDKDNPGTYRGTVFDNPFLAVFDTHWITERIGVDWKRSKHNKKYDDNYEIQAYILNELFRQAHGFPLEKFYFIFLKDGFRYEAQSIYVGETRAKIELKIITILENINRLNFPKHRSYACEWCDYRGYCL